MLTTVLATSLALVDPFDLVRVDDPDHPDAIARSETGALLVGPPEPGTSWRWASIPETDAWPAQEALDVTNVEKWHAVGARGAGVRVAVFDLGWFGPGADLAELGDVQTADCFAHPSCELPMDLDRARTASEDGVHGVACAEVIRDVAPEAELFLVRVNALTMFENAVWWAIRHDIDVISMSMSFYNDSFYDGLGPFHPLMAALEAHDILLVTSSGNNADSHWYGPYEDGDGDGRLDFGGSNGLLLDLAQGTRSVYVNWNQHYRCGDTDLDVFVYDESGEVLAGRSEDRQDADGDRCQSVERVAIRANSAGTYRLEVHHAAGLRSDLALDILGRAGIAFQDNRPERSLADPAAHPFAFAVGAVRARNYLYANVERFSSRGPNHAGQAKPDIAGPDGLTTDAYGPGGFFGTSASTPVVAGLLAVLMSDEPALTPREAAVRLQAMALRSEVGTSQPDPRWGAGKARLPLPRARPQPCGRRPLVLPFLLLPVWWLPRRRNRLHIR